MCYDIHESLKGISAPRHRLSWSYVLDPRLSTDDRTLIEEWFQRCRQDDEKKKDGENKKGPISPLTGKALESYELRPNIDAKNSVEKEKQRIKAAQDAKRRESLAKAGGSANAPAGGGVTNIPPTGGGGGAGEAKSNEGVKAHAHSVNDLAGVFKAIDPLRELFSSMSWQPPRVSDLSSIDAILWF